MNTLKRYWFIFPRFSSPTALNVGCGATAYNYDDAVNLLRDCVFGGNEPNVIDVKEDVDVSKLDKDHVIPNMGPVVVRGIWFPLGYDKSAGEVNSFGRC